jgi:hypothetical protein
MRARVWAAGGVKVNSSKLVQTSRIAIMYDVIMNGEIRRAVGGLASKLWVPGRAGIHGRPLLVFVP